MAPARLMTRSLTTERIVSESATSTLAEELGLDERVNEKELYSAMAWLLKRQDRIERRLAEMHLDEGKPVLYDLSSTCYEGSTCVLAQRGYSRDGKKRSRQINFGLLCSSQGCPVAVEVFPGNTADPSTLQAQLDKLRERFGMEKIPLVGDRGMLTSARIEVLRESETFAWISALENDGVRKLAQSGAIQMELFDKRDLAEIECPEHFAGERLVVCMNPALRAERSRKRSELLELSEGKLGAIAQACCRSRNPYRGKERIARRVEREVSSTLASSRNPAAR